MQKRWKYFVLIMKDFNAACLIRVVIILVEELEESLAYVGEGWIATPRSLMHEVSFVSALRSSCHSCLLYL